MIVRFITKRLFAYPKANFLLKMEDAKVRALCDEFWQWRMRQSPEFASFCGDQRYSHLLDDIDPDNFEEFEEDVSKLLEKAEEIQVNQLSKRARNALLLVKDQMDTFVDGMKHKCWYFPINFMDGLHVDAPKVMSTCPTKTVEDFRNLNKRIRCYEKKARSCIHLLKEGVDHGHVNHLYSIEGVPEQLDTMITAELTPEKDVFLAPYKKFPASIEPSIKDELLAEAKEIVQNVVRPAFKELAEYIENDYMKYLRTDISIYSLPNGEELYQDCLEFHLSLSMTPQQVFDIGKVEVERITQAMHKITQEEGFGTDIRKFKEDISKRDEFHCKTPEELIDYVKHICFDQIQPKLPLLFKESPKSRLKIEPTPPLMDDGPVAFYFNGSPDGSRPGVYYISTSNLQVNPKYELPALCLHEGEPGHHFQGMISMEMKELHAFRRANEDLNYAWVPSRFPMYTAYLEGWGLYCEYLGEELGLYEDNYTLFGRYCGEILRAARLVVDTGIHAFGWTFEEALNYMVEKTFLDVNTLEIEVKRYVTLPGQACAYKIGEIVLKQLRQKASLALGDKFDVREFHSVVLRCGSVPLKFLAQKVDEYIKDTLES
ncbi:uncharacterized protein LOC133185430 [Saccostrea echinata]|uniref:uncharacterized protein LOC133185430 n=1 Tax=Saccostrea echinata TaxID=191078 RepID=UPI002A8419F2|nr:uncharacterized protein LOC133185430 [Saccostrea echinata]